MIYQWPDRSHRARSVHEKIGRSRRKYLSLELRLLSTVTRGKSQQNKFSRAYKCHSITRLFCMSILPLADIDFENIANDFKCNLWRQKMDCRQSYQPLNHTSESLGIDFQNLNRIKLFICKIMGELSEKNKNMNSKFRSKNFVWELFQRNSIFITSNGRTKLIIFYKASINKE